MQAYFIHKDNQQQGPFSIEELKDQSLTRDTMVWYEGLDGWIKAEEVVELTGLFKMTPPPLIKEMAETKNDRNTTQVANPKSGSSKTMIIFGLVAVAIICFVVYILQSKKQAEIERHLSRQREIFLEQSDKIEQQQKLEEARYEEAVRREEEEATENRKEQLESLQKQYEIAIANLRDAEYELEEIQKFVFLRTASEKREQVNQQMEVVREWELQVEKVKRALDNF